MSKHQIYIILGLVSVALLGIIGIQIDQISKAIALHEKNFNAGVNDALNQVVDRVYSNSVQTKYFRLSRQIGIADSEGNFGPSINTESNKPLLKEIPSVGDISSSSPRRVLIRDSVSYVREQETLINEDSVIWGPDERNWVYVSDGSDSLFQNVGFEMRGDPRIVKIMSAAIKGAHADALVPEEKIDSLQLDTLIRDALRGKGIYQSFEYAIGTFNKKLISFKESSQDISIFLSSQHRVELFPYLGLPDKRYLFLLFPDENIVALKSVWIQAGASMLFSFIILFCMGVTVRTILRQKKLSEMKNDFINNMTHELKTPIATISLAADALKTPQIQASEEGVLRYIGIIKEENQRMNRQVERVLQAARFDRKEIILKKEAVDMHQLIQKAAQNIALQVSQRDGQLLMNLDATVHELYGDRVHLTNIIYNLLDNANKYSPEEPDINLSTFNEGDKFVIRVSDKGQGINKADLPHIFTRFYRVSTGDLHDVKGFGLGLSYVKDIVEAHGGTISVQSTPGKGSTFEVSLPMNETKDESHFTRRR